VEAVKTIRLQRLNADTGEWEPCELPILDRGGYRQVVFPLGTYRITDPTGHQKQEERAAHPEG
jgi:hypothetical protein